MISKKLKLLSIYSRDFLFYSILMSFLSYYSYYVSGLYFLTAIIWFKLTTTAIGIFIHQDRKAKELFFYMNNGLAKKELMTAAVIVDLGIWIFGMIVIVKWTL